MQSQSCAILFCVCVCVCFFFWGGGDFPRFLARCGIPKRKNPDISVISEVSFFSFFLASKRFPLSR